MPEDGRSRRRRWIVLLLACYWAALFVGTHIPVRAEKLPRVSDKLMHFAAYAGLAFQLGLVFAATGDITLRQYLLAAAVVAAYGVLDELSQIPVGRTADWRDLLADLLGVAAGLCLLRLLQRPLSAYVSR